MRLLPVILAFLLLACPLLAADERAGPQTSAAIVDARETLRRQVLAASITRGLTVQELIDQTGGADELDKRLQTAQQIGGARWLDEQTVQVRLTIEGASVAQALTQIVAKNPAAAPLPPQILHRALADWRNRTFSATGTSAGASDITRLQPPAADAAWAAIPAADRNRALGTARDNAITRVLDSLRPIEIQNNQTLDAAMAAPEVSSALSTWLIHRPVTSVEFRDDLSVRVVLSAPPDGLWQVLRTAMDNQKLVRAPATPDAWKALQKQVEARLAPAIGVGIVQAGGAVAQPDLSLPDLVPSWVTRQLQAQATSPTRGSKLHTARAAEAMAIQNLRHQAEALKLRDNLTIAQAARQNPRIEQSLTKALDRAGPYQVDYGANGDVTVYVSLSLADLWSLLCDPH